MAGRQGLFQWSYILCSAGSAISLHNITSRRALKNITPWFAGGSAQPHCEAFKSVSANSPSALQEAAGSQYSVQ